MRAQTELPASQKAENASQNATSKPLVIDDQHRVYAILRRLAARITELESTSTALKRDLWRIEKKHSREVNDVPSLLEKNRTVEAPVDDEFKGLFGLE